MMIKVLLSGLFVLSVGLCASCDLRSGIAKNNMEKYVITPTPFIPPPTPEPPVDPADIIQVDTTAEGERISINGYEQVKTVDCKKFNRVIVNGQACRVTVTGACNEIVVNGDENEVTADAAMKFVINGVGNTIKYARFANGKRPVITQSQAGNTVEKIEPPAKDKRPGQNTAK